MAFSQAVRRQPDSAHALRNQASLLNDLDMLALIGAAASAATACASV
jgi:hypothetical protein